MAEHSFCNNPAAETAYLRLLLHQKGLPYESVDRALDTYEIERRLADDYERCLLIDYGYANIVEDIYNKQPIGEQWRVYEATLFNVKERALSHSRYHILSQAFQQRQNYDIQEDLTSY